LRLLLPLPLPLLLWSAVVVGGVIAGSSRAVVLYCGLGFVVVV